MRSRTRAAAAALAMISALPLSGVGIPSASATSHLAQAATDEKELTGQVLRTQGNTIFVKGTGGEAVQIQVTGNTLVNGTAFEQLQRSGSTLRDKIQPGADVTAQFYVRRSGGELNNVATSVHSKP